MNIQVSNDDGIQSSGIRHLALAAKRMGKVTIVTPETQQTAQGKSLTFNSPIRIHKVEVDGLEAYGHSGVPADSLILYEHFTGKTPDVVLSGINGGENTSVHSILTSGTCGVAMEAGLRNIPAFAFSMDVPEEYFFAKSLPFDMETIANIAVDVAKVFLEAPKDFWNRILFVNVNFPHEVNHETKMEVVGLETYKYINYLVERIDPKGEQYFWLWGEKRKDWQKDKDSYKVIFDNTITITPVTFGIYEKTLNAAKDVLKESKLTETIKEYFTEPR
ncbi:MAG: 5'/3'-nucleotidase SurE [Methanobacteriota archaeon]|nr:MAG: 5'/3'-nucleotidase SurE [Euryarchaeota archaeon]